MNVRSTLIASALVSTLVVAACGTEASSPSLSGYVPQQSAANYEDGLVVAAKTHLSGPGGTKTHTRPRCRMASDAVEKWLTDGVVPRCQLVAGRQHGQRAHHHR
jgi:hypothetical protein